MGSPFRPGFRSRRNSFPSVRKPINTSYVSTNGVNIISTATTVDNALLVTADSPDKTIITVPGTTAAQVENNSRIIKRGSFLRMSAYTDAIGALFTIWVYKNPRGTITAPTVGNDFNTGPLTEDNIQLRKNTIYYWRGLLSAEQIHRFRIPLFSRRNNFLLDLSTLRLFLANQSATDNINYMHYGRIRTIEG